MSILSRQFLGRARLFRQLVEDWQSAPNHTLFVREVGELIDEASAMRVLAQSTRDTIKRRLRERNPENIELDGIAMKQAIGHIQAGLVSLGEIMRTGQNRNLAPANVDSLPATVAVIDEIREDLNRWFPIFDPEQAKEAIEAIKRGEYITMEALINETRSAIASGS